jgi:hypothetical protein
MDVASQKKVIDAGFIILRCDDHPSLRIKVKDGNDANHTGSCYEWRTFEKDFATKAARNRRFKELLEQSKIIED